MSAQHYLERRWRGFLGLTIAGGMVAWGKFLDPVLLESLSSVYATYWVLCAVASLASIALALQEMRLQYARRSVS